MVSDRRFRVFVPAEVEGPTAQRSAQRMELAMDSLQTIQLRI